jgi:hypothetical protein
VTAAPTQKQQDPVGEAIWAKVLRAFSMAEIEEAERLVSEYHRAGNWLDHSGETLYYSRYYAQMRIDQAQALGLSEADTERRERLYRSVGHEKQSEIQKVLVEAQAWLADHPDDLNIHNLIDLAQSKLNFLRLWREVVLSVKDGFTTDELAELLKDIDVQESV